MIPLPLVPMREAGEAEKPRTSRTLEKLARELGWRLWTTYARVYEPDTSHYGPDGHWDQAKQVTRDEPQFDKESGQPLMTEEPPRAPGAKPRKTPYVPKQRVKKVPTGVLVVSDSLVVRGDNGRGQRFWASWADGKFETAQVNHPSWLTLSSPELTAYVREHGVGGSIPKPRSAPESSESVPVSS